MFIHAEDFMTKILNQKFQYHSFNRASFADFCWML